VSSVLRFFKTNELPAVPEANAVYFVLDGVGDFAETYVTDRFGGPKAVGNTLFIDHVNEALDLRFATKEYVDDALGEGVGLDPDFILDGGNF
jgi:hypothetical protein